MLSFLAVVYGIGGIIFSTSGRLDVASNCWIVIAILLVGQGIINEMRR